MPFENVYNPGTINQIGQGLSGPGERRGFSGTLSAHTAASIAFGTSTTRFQHSPYFFNQLNPLFYGPSPELRSEVPNPLMQQQSFIQQVFGYRTPYWQGISGLHPGNRGYGTSTVRSLTDFGSGFDRDKALSRAASILTNPVVGGLATTALLGVPSFHDPFRVTLLGAQAAALGYARGGPIGSVVGLAAFYALDKAGQGINKAAAQGTYQQPTNWDVMRHFMLYGLVEGGLAAGTSAAFLQGSPVRPLAQEAVGLAGGIRSLLTGKSFNASAPIEGLASEFQEVASPFRRWYQSSVVHSAGFFEKKLGMKPDFAMKFSEAFHGESAYVMRAAQRYGGSVRDIPNLDFYKALGKDIAIGSAGGLFENILVGGAYIALTQLLNKPIRISGKDDDYNTISGMHPGADATMGAMAIQGMSAFGSGLRLDKVLNWDRYSERITTEHRQYIKDILKSVPGANIIGFDIETTGLISPLESITRGQPVGRLTEFAVGSTGNITHGFTEQASMEQYTRLSLGGGSFAGEFQQAGKRYGKYYGKAYKASDVLGEIVNRIQPGRTNIITGHNIHAFDIKFLSAELAIERGYVTQKAIDAMASLPIRTQEHYEARSAIQAGWEKANRDIRKAIFQKDSNALIVDTLGGFKRGEFPRTFNEMRGITQAYMGGYIPGVSSFWRQHFQKLGFEDYELYDATRFASSKGTALSPIMSHFGIAFKGAEHDPRADVEAAVRFLSSTELAGRVSELDKAISANKRSVLGRETGTFIKRQIAIQRETMGSPTATEGAKLLAERMVQASQTTGTSIPSRTLEEAFTKLPEKTQWLVAGAAGALAYAGYRMFFAPTKTVRDNQIQGMHPGDGGYSTPLIQQMTPFGSGFNPVKMLISARLAAKVNKVMMSEDLLADEFLRSNPDYRAKIIRKINGLHPGNSDNGVGIQIIRGMTDFGSGWDASKSLYRSLIRQQRQKEKMFAAIYNPKTGHRLTAEGIEGLVEHSDLLKKVDPKEKYNYVEGFINARGNFISRKSAEEMYGRSMSAEFYEPTHDIKDMPTTGLVNHVLDPNAIKHNRYPGKSP